MSPVFGHGRLRLYLLKLLEESPRHGYEVIRLLQDRFLGVYSPSPGTIYPRLARLEAEGLVTHEMVKGKKVYSLTDAGRAELERRMDELAELEDEISASAQKFAREVQQDVRQTVRSLREELTQAARTVREQSRQATREAWQGTADSTRDVWRETAETAKDAWRGTAGTTKEEWLRQKEQWREQTQLWKEEWRRNWEDAWRTATGSREDVRRLKLERLLSSFVGDVRSAAAGGGFTDDDLRRVRAVLDEARDRITESLRDGDR
ncbi:PadR family transcriptional regulator [Actinomadura atramentaria]|uniref:PadR family transcriptional regulator n=1 Tax=Actinomadura atramentaria TaxID=1990 RepID=UPI0003745C9A|nr:PadR family transcriptional regulator [Actinomadura atramentaria]